MKNTASNLTGNINALLWADNFIINQAVVLWRHLLCQMSQNCVPTVMQPQKHCKGGRKRVWQLNIMQWLWSDKGIHYRATENLPSNNSRQTKQQHISIAPVAIICEPCYAMVCRYLWNISLQVSTKGLLYVRRVWVMDYPPQSAQSFKKEAFQGRLVLTTPDCLWTQGWPT